MVKKLSGLAGITAVKSGIECIEVPGVQVILGNAQGFTEALVVDDLPGSEELDGFTDIRILDQAQNVVVGGAGFLFRSHIFVQICDDVSFYLKFTGIEGHTACCLRPDTNGVIHIIIGKSAFLDLFHGEVTGQLVNDGGNHFQMSKLFGSYIRCDIAHLKNLENISIYDTSPKITLMIAEVAGLLPPFPKLKTFSLLPV